MMGVLAEIKGTVTSVLAKVGIDGENVLLGVAIGVVSFFGTIALTGAVLVRLPPDYITNEHPKKPDRADIRGRLGLWGRHLVGVLLIVLGLVLMLPGVPGQGLLTVIAGLFISELPGTGKLLRRILRWPKTLAAVNALRARYKHPPLQTSAPPEEDVKG
ncbi:MAG: hypothetical protein U0441_07405 [Polyangiaceae bacterium]